METALELGRRAALLKLADAGLAPSRPASLSAPAPAAPSTPAPAAAPRPPLAAPPASTSWGQSVGNWFRNPANMAQLVGASGDLGKGILGATGAPGLFALSNLARGGRDLGNILRGGIPTGNQPG